MRALDLWGRSLDEKSWPPGASLTRIRRKRSTPITTISYITTVQFDFGAVRLLRQECERVGITRPLIVSDRGVRAAGLVDRVTAHLENSIPFTIYDRTPSNPT